MPDSDDRLLIARLKEENRALEARLEKYSNVIQFYRELGQAMTSTLDIHELLDLVANWTGKLINADLVVVPLINNDKDEYYYVSASGEGAENIVGASFALDVGMCGWVLMHKETLVFAEGHEFLMEKKTLWEDGDQSALLVPLIGKKGIIGGLGCLGKKDAKCFSQDDIDMLTLFANSVSPAIENAGLFNEINHMVNTLEQQVAYRTKALQEATQTSEAVSKQLLHAQEIAHLGNWEWNIVTGELLWSDEVCRIYGLSRQQFGATYEAYIGFVHPNDRSRLAEAVKRAVNDPDYLYSIEHRVVRPDGSERIVQEVGEVLRDGEGRSTRMSGTVQDITERKNIEDELKRSNNELDQFAYAISHDMRQPLRMITSYLSLIEKELVEQLNDNTRQYLKFATDGAKRMDRMILAMLDYSRVGRKTDSMASIVSREVLDDTLGFLKPDITAKNATVEVTGEWCELTASRDELTRLLQNLIGNALKYHAPDQPPRVEVHAATTPTLFRVTIRDHGIGIDPKQTDRLFKVFSRLQDRTRFEGTGVGLALCRKIVEHHGGRIGVESAGEGCGSIFWFELPRTG